MNSASSDPVLEGPATGPLAAGERQVLYLELGILVDFPPRSAWPGPCTAIDSIDRTVRMRRPLGIARTMHRFTEQSTTSRRTSPWWNAAVCLLILLHGLLPTLHAVSCVEHVCAESAAAAGLQLEHFAAATATEELRPNVEHECSLCRVLSHLSLLQNPDERPLGVADACDEIVADALQHHPAWAPLRDDLGRAPPTTSLWS